MCFEVVWNVALRVVLRNVLRLFECCFEGMVLRLFEGCLEDALRFYRVLL